MNFWYMARPSTPTLKQLLLSDTVVWIIPTYTTKLFYSACILNTFSPNKTDLCQLTITCTNVLYQWLSHPTYHDRRTTTIRVLTLHKKVIVHVWRNLSLHWAVLFLEAPFTINTVVKKRDCGQFWIINWYCSLLFNSMCPYLVRASYREGGGGAGIPPPPPRERSPLSYLEDLHPPFSAAYSAYLAECSI